MRIATIGSRDLPRDALEVCEKLGKFLVANGHLLFSGNAQGADQAFARGGNQVDASRVHLMLPWKSYEEGRIHPDNYVLSVEDLTEEERLYYFGLAREYHPRFDALSQGARKLMMRNGMIIQPPIRGHWERVDLVLAYPSGKLGGGGTGQGMRAGAGLGIEVVDLSKMDRSGLRTLCESLKLNPY